MTSKTMGLITFCGHWTEFLIKVLKVDEFNIVLDRNLYVMPLVGSHRWFAIFCGPIGEALAPNG